MILDVTFEETTKTLFDCIFDEGNSGFNVDFGEIKTVTEYIGGEVYNGDYVVTPSVEAQTIPTKDKVMAEDLTVDAIPIYNVSNLSGGKTVYIG